MFCCYATLKENNFKIFKHMTRLSNNKTLFGFIFPFITVLEKKVGQLKIAAVKLPVNEIESDI
jgi:hypothetical protein